MVVFWKDILKAGAIVLAIALLNLVGFIEYSRIDLTENGAHSLTPVLFNCLKMISITTCMFVFTYQEMTFLLR